MTMRFQYAKTWLSVVLVAASMIGCDGVSLPIDDLLNGNGNINGNTNINSNDNSGGDGGGSQDLAELQTHATNTNGATGIALRPSDGALFAVNSDGLFGPIAEGDDLASMTPIGATNLGDMDLFDQPTSSLVLAITGAGEFWIGAQCCQTLAVVPAEGGDAAEFAGLGGGSMPSNIKPETLSIVPSGFDGPQIMPGQLLVGQETTFSRLAVIDVAGDRTVVNVDNEGTENRNAHHLTFGLDGILYSSKGVAALTQPGLQMIDTNGVPTALVGTLGIAAESFVALANGDLVIRGTWQTGPTESRIGILFYTAMDQNILLGTAIPRGDLSEDDEMIITDDGATIFLSLPNRNEIVRVVDLR